VEAKSKHTIETLRNKLSSCTLCPRKCKVDRASGETGYCGSDSRIFLSSVFAHFGEERELVGRYGSGTIFFTHCNLKCVFCQNYELSHMGKGYEISIGELISHMMSLQENGCHNVNLVTPTHYMPQIAESLYKAKRNGLTIPVVYNCGGYESSEMLTLIEGLVDIYMPDIKFFDLAASRDFLNAYDYPRTVKKAVLEMHRQVGDLEVDDTGIAKRGLLIRHLVMPGFSHDTQKILSFIAENIGSDTYVNIMAQYSPCYNASQYQQINRRTTMNEYKTAISYARDIGLSRGFGGT